MRRRDFLAAAAAAASVPPGVRMLYAAEEARHDQGARPSSASAGPADAPYVLVLGSVQDGGFPQAGCTTDLCEHGRALHREGRGRYVASLALVDPGSERFWLVDATPDITRQMDLVTEPSFRRRCEERRPFDGIFLTHAHIGHYTGLAQLGNEGLGMRPTPTYCTEAMAGFLASNAPWSFLVAQERILLRPLATETWHRVDEGLEVQLLPVPHRNEFADTVGFVFRGPRAAMLYIPDINAWHLWERDLAEVVASVDVALLDASFWSLDELPGRSLADVPHPLVGQTMDLLQEVVDRGGSRVLLTHLNNTNPVLWDDGPQAAEVARRGFLVAREGMRFPL